MHIPPMWISWSQRCALEITKHHSARVSAWCKEFVKGMSVDGASGKSMTSAWWIQAARSTALVAREGRFWRSLLQAGSEAQTGGLIALVLGVCLFLSHVSDQRQLPHLAGIGLDQKNDPEGKHSQPNQEVKGKQHQSEDRDKGKDRERDRNCNHRYSEEDTLKRVEADEAALVIRFDHQKYDRRNKSHIGEHAGHVVGQPACPGGNGLCRGSCRAAARRTNCVTFWCLSATYCAKGHNVPL